METTGVLHAKRTIDVKLLLFFKGIIYASLMLYLTSKQKNFISFSLKKQIKDMKSEISFKDDEIKKLKRNIKLTKIQELEVVLETMNLFF